MLERSSSHTTCAHLCRVCCGQRGSKPQCSQLYNVGASARRRHDAPTHALTYTQCTMHVRCVRGKREILFYMMHV